ncbi:MAG: tyrosine-type recombinase/integrase [Aliidongia sp.]
MEQVAHQCCLAGLARPDDVDDPRRGQGRGQLGAEVSRKQIIAHIALPPLVDQKLYYQMDGSFNRFWAEVPLCGLDTIVGGHIGATLRAGFSNTDVGEHSEPIRPPDDQDVAAVLARAPGQLAALIRFLALEGCRQEEGAGLTWSQVRLPRNEILLTKTKTDRPRVIRIGNETVKPLSALPRHMTSRMVFWRDDGERYCNVASRFREIVKSAQKAAQAEGRDFTPFRCHDLRHRYAIRQLEAGRDIYDLSRPLVIAP